jgi:hypothetical protein
MGLDVTSYSRLTPAPHAELESDGAPVNWRIFWRLRPEDISNTEHLWPGRTEGIAPPGVYSANDRLTFRAGSYSGFNEWRDTLAKCAGYPSARAVWETPDQFSGQPFVELLNFSDCEGVIGPVVAAKLAADFAAADARITLAMPGMWFLQLYAYWRLAFMLAADGGAVEFH